MLISELGFCPRIRKSLSGSDVGLQGTGSPKKGNYIRDHIQDPIYCACISRQLKHFWKSYMKGYVKVTQEAGCWRTEPLLRDINDQTCRNKHWSTLENAINAKGLLQAFINPGVLSTLYLVRVPLPNRGLDIVGPFLNATGSRRWLLVGTNYFTKSVEAEPLANIRDTGVKRFIWKNIVTWFGVPRVLISNNGL